MTVPDDETMVRIWERGSREHPIDRGLTLLASLSGRPRAELADLSIRERDESLLALRTVLFSAPLSGYAQCPRCGCEIDVSLDAGDPEEGDDPDDGLLWIEGRAVRYRLPNSVDLAAAAQCGQVDEARRLLIDRCIDDTGNDGRPGPELIAAVESVLDERAGRSVATVGLRCPDCDHDWVLTLDVAEFFFEEVAAVARGLLHEVDQLARSYGWGEAEILALGPVRRRVYLELVG